MPSIPPVNQGEIRLLKILEAGPIIKGRLQVFALDKLPEDGYSALSYCWGTEPPTSRLFIENAQVEILITPTLASALRELYAKEKVRDLWYWVDQICIKQDDTSEKKQQVEAMDRVYSSAGFVLVWLGEASADSDLVMDNISGLVDVMGLLAPQDEAKYLDIRNQLPPRMHPLWRAIVDFYRRPWFQRVWTLQEVVLSGLTVVLCGSKSCDFSKISAFANNFMYIGRDLLFDAAGDSGDPMSGIVSCSMVAHYLRWRGVQTISKFNFLLNAARERKATLPIDHLYGIRAIVPAEFRTMINVNYDIPYHEAVIAFCKVYIERDPLLTLLHMAPSKVKATGLPSWCPDFGQLGSESQAAIMYKAGFIHERQRVSRILCSACDDSILVPGWRVDEMDQLVQFDPDDSEIKSSNEEAERNIAWMNECEKVFTNSMEHDPTTDEWETFCETLIAGSDYRSEIGLVLDGITQVGSHFPPDDGPPLCSVYQAFKAYATAISRGDKSTFQSAGMKDAVDKMDAAISMQSRKTFFVTKNNWTGMGPRSCQKGDIAVVFDSGACIWVLRPINGQEIKHGSVLVGCAYMPGFMVLAQTPASSRGVEEVFTIF